MPHEQLCKAVWAVRRTVATICRSTLAGLLVSGPTFAVDIVVQPPGPMVAHMAVITADDVEPVLAKRLKRAGFGQESASRDARAVANWVVDSGDSQGMPFTIVDKKDAKVFVFGADGRLRGAGPALLGLAIGDDAVPDIGNRALSTIRPGERTTPAGRFVASMGRNLKGKEILWVDYAGAVSMHPVVSGTPLERRLQRLTSLTPNDNRITYGCINVPVQFFDKVVRPAFTGTSGIVYVLPETRSAQILFGSYDVEERARVRMANRPSAP